MWKLGGDPASLFAARRQYVGIVGNKVEIPHESLALRIGKFREFTTDTFDLCRAYHNRQQVRIWKVAIVVRFLFTAHRPGFVAIRIVKPGFLDYGTAVFDDIDLPFDLDLDRIDAV